jgi:hypothetical protein
MPTFSQQTLGSGGVEKLGDKLRSFLQGFTGLLKHLQSMAPHSATS